MALTPDEIDALTIALETLAGAGGSLKELRGLLTAISNTDLSGISSSVSEVTDAIRAQTASNNASIASLEARVRALQNEASAYEGTTQELDKQIKAQQAGLELAREQQRVQDTDFENVKAQEKALKSLTEQKQDLTQKSQELKSVQQQLTSSGKEFAQSLFAGDKAGAQMIGSVKSLTKGMSDLAVKKVAGAKSLGRFAGAAAGGLSLVFEFAAAIARLALEVFNASAEFQKVTGTSQDFANSVVKNFDETRKFGGSLKDVSAAGQALTATFTDFTMTSEGTRDSLIKTGVALTKLGVSTGDFAKGVQLATKALGQNGLQAEETQRELAALAMDIGVAPSKMASDFASAGPHLAKFGRDGTKAFKDLAIASKITGIEVGRLLTITEKFDTFEGAAEQAGRLNAALGGNFVNAMELMTATDPVERFNMLRDSVLDAGLSFDEMSYYQRKFFADSMGLQDVGELALVMSGKMDSLNGEIGKTSAEYEAMAERAHTVQSFQEQLNALFADMIPLLMPVVEGLQGFMSILSENRDVVQAIGVGLGVIATMMAATAVGTLATASPFILLFGVLSAIGYLLFRQSFASSFLEGLVKFGDAISFMGDNAEGTSGQIKSLLAQTNKLGKNGLFGSNGLKVATESTTKSVDELNVAMASAAASNASATTEANTYTMSQVGDSINNNTQNYMGSREPMNVHLNVDGRKLAMATVGPMIRKAAIG